MGRYTRNGRRGTLCDWLVGWIDHSQCSAARLSQVDNMVMSIGWNPQYQNEKKTLEVHLLRKFDKDFYGSMMDVLILGFIRPMSAFNSLGKATSSLACN
ncbi:hypothetical protein Y032_0059g2999 [Ancylostoma ceylanicum]|uniref:riboflavin kinase n=1 Tax=Ancylostoma ceylanicum TaxID=53326 RepID=A0A016U3Z0_9BILA|nr:hypothetical protein Y032_0059g2999 [Ancylostoma ceylanicum]